MYCSELVRNKERMKTTQLTNRWSRIEKHCSYVFVLMNGENSERKLALNSVFKFSTKYHVNLGLHVYSKDSKIQQLFPENYFLPVILRETNVSHIFVKRRS